MDLRETDKVDPTEEGEDFPQRNEPVLDFLAMGKLLDFQLAMSFVLFIPILGRTLVHPLQAQLFLCVCGGLLLVIFATEVSEHVGK